MEVSGEPGEVAGGVRKEVVKKEANQGEHMREVADGQRRAGVVVW